MNAEQTVNDREMMRVAATPTGTFEVVSSRGMTLASGFITNADAWDWIDRHSREGRADTDRHHRIRQSASFS